MFISEIANENNCGILAFVALKSKVVGHTSEIIHEGDTPSPLAYCVPLYFGIAYCVPPFFGLAYCVPFNNKKQPFWAFPFT